MNTLQIVEDTREQRPLNFAAVDAASRRDTVRTFDYCLDGDQGFAIERKSLPDLINSITRKSNFERELRKIQRAREAGMPHIIYVVEANFQDIANYSFDFSQRLTPQFVYKRWRYLAFNQGVHFIWAGDEQGAAHAVYLILKSRHEQLTRGTPVMPTAHAKYSPSTLNYRAKCPGYAPGTGGAAADEGTLMHHAAETGEMEDLNPEQRAQVEMCLQYVDSLLAPGGRLMREKCVRVHGSDGEELTWGTSDIVIVNPDEVHVVDFKFGQLPVPDAEHNLQGWAYLLGVWELPETQGIDRATVHFLLPRRDEISLATFTRTDHHSNMLAKIEEVVTRCLMKDPTRVAGKHCRYCSAKAQCSEFIGKTLAVAKQTDSSLPDIPQLSDVKSLTDPRMLGQVLDLVPMIEDWAKQVRSHALDMARQGVDIEGYHLATRNAARTIKDVLLAWEVAEELGVPLEEFLPSCSIAIGKYDAAIRKAAPPRKGKSHCEAAHQKLAAYGVETSDGEIDYLKREKQ